jgi:acetyl esterase/lipase
MAASKSLMDSPEAHQVLRENSLRYFDGVPTTPTYLWHGRYDELTPYDGVAEFADRYCRAGAPVKLTTYDIAEHMTAAVAGFADAWNFVEARFRGEPMAKGC